MIHYVTPVLNLLLYVGWLYLEIKQGHSKPTRFSWIVYALIWVVLLPFFTFLFVVNIVDPRIDHLLVSWLYVLGYTCGIAWTLRMEERYRKAMYDWEFFTALRLTLRAGRYFMGHGIGTSAAYGGAGVAYIMDAIKEAAKIADSPSGGFFLADPKVISKISDEHLLYLVAVSAYIPPRHMMGKTVTHEINHAISLTTQGNVLYEMARRLKLAQKNSAPLISLTIHEDGHVEEEAAVAG